MPFGGLLSPAEFAADFLKVGFCFEKQAVQTDGRVINRPRAERPEPEGDIPTQKSTPSPSCTEWVHREQP